MKTLGTFILTLALATVASAQAPKPGPSAGELIKRADEKVVAGDLDGAAKLLREAATADPSSAEPLMALGRLGEKRLELDTAIDAYKAAAEKLQGPAKGEALGHLAVLYCVRGGADPTPVAEAAYAADPAGPWPLVALSRVRSLAGKGDEALDLASKAAAAGAGVQATVATGYAQEARGDLKTAEAAFREVLTAAPGHPCATVGLSRVLRRTGRAAEALPMLLKLIDAAPGAVSAYKESARVKIALGKADEAVGDAQIASALAEGDRDAQALVREVTVAKALSNIGSGQVTLAVQDLTKARDEAPDSPEIRLGLARALIAAGQTDPAVVELKKAVELDPQSADAAYQLGITLHLRKKDAAGAVPYLTKAAELQPANGDYGTARAAALAETKDFDGAIAELQRVTALPGYDKADGWVQLGAAYVATKRYPEAVTALDHATTKAPDNPAAQAYLGWACFGLKDAAAFKEHAGKAKALGWKDPTLLDYLRRVEAGEKIK